ncbi:MAG: biopolymer transporter ExbD [Marinobacter sp.]|nr:biopolymer transporter ExbD [Marinobacter sp.]
MQLVEPRPPRRLPIRITPLIDVVFILLVFFMLTTHLLPTSHLALDNQVPTGGTSSGDLAPVLTLHPDNLLRWEHYSLPAGEAADRLRTAGVTEARLETEGDVSLGAFTQAMSHLNAAGIETQWVRDRQP